MTNIRYVQNKGFLCPRITRQAWESKVLREGCGKSKWKFKMAFAMKGGGSRGGLVCH